MRMICSNWILCGAEIVILWRDITKGASMSRGIAASTSSTVAPVRRMTEQEFLAWIEREDVRAEWVDGEAFELMPPEWGHKRLSWFLATVIGLIADLRGLGHVVTAQFGMRLGPGRSYREPDVMFVATEHLGLVDGAWLNGPADLAVEIVSDESESRDLVVKLREYAELGVREY